MTYFFLRSTFKFQKVNLKKFHKNENNISLTIDYKKDFIKLKKILKNDIYISRKQILKNFKISKLKKNIKRKIPIKTNYYDVSFKNNDQTILL